MLQSLLTGLELATYLEVGSVCSNNKYYPCPCLLQSCYLARTSFVASPGLKQGQQEATPPCPHFCKVRTLFNCSELLCPMGAV